MPLIPGPPRPGRLNPETGPRIRELGRPHGWSQWHQTLFGPIPEVSLLSPEHEGLALLRSGSQTHDHGRNTKPLAGLRFSQFPLGSM